MNPNMGFIGTLQKSRFWWVRVGFMKQSHIGLSGFERVLSAWCATSFILDCCLLSSEVAPETQLQSQVVRAQAESGGREHWGHPLSVSVAAAEEVQGRMSRLDVFIGMANFSKEDRRRTYSKDPCEYTGMHFVVR